MLRAIEDPVIPGWRKRAVYAAAFVAILLPAVVLAAFHLDLPSLGAYHDDGVYLVTAKAIAQGKGYRIESLPDERWQTKYPPVFPVALAVIWRLSSLHFAENLGGFLIVAWLALPALLLLQARMLARLEFRLSSQVVARLCIPAYQSTLQLSVTLLSDLWFCCEILFAVWLAERASEPDAHWKFSAAAGLAAALVYLTKSAGIVLFPSIAGVMVSRGRWRHALVFCAIFGPAVATWRAWSVTYLHPVADYNDVFYSSYLQEFTYKQPLTGLFPHLAAGAREFFVLLGSALIPELLSGVVFDWLRLLAGILGVVGVVFLCRSGRVWHYAAFASLYALEMCVWPSRLFPRYILAVFPLWIAGLLTLPRYYRAAAGSPRYPNNVPIWGPLAAAMLAFIYVIQSVAGIHAAAAWRSERRALERAYAWIAHSTPPTASVVAFRDPVLYSTLGATRKGCTSAAERMACREF